MTDILHIIKESTKTFEDFRKWLFIKLGKNPKSFSTFGSYPNRQKIPYLIEYLESKEVPILSALIYYMWKGSSHNMSYELLCIYMIREEFKRIESNKTINYIPF